ncbi:hypothetical protein B0T26DRAFT_653111, partial [Lasiosphaeria miniovina]
MDVSDRGVVLPNDFGPSIDISNQTLLIYAETVTIMDSIQWPSKNIGIACSNLILGGSSITIDVSGSDGEHIDVAQPSGNGLPGNPGGDGGSIWLYVEYLTPSLATGLRLLANGGSGGEGGATSDVAGRGGTGGVGGNAGTVSFLWGSAAGTALLRLYQLSPLPWTALVGQALTVTTLTSSLLGSAQFAALRATFAQYTGYITAAQNCRAAVNSLAKSRTTKPLSTALSTALTAFSQGLTTLLTAQEGPDLKDNGLANATVAVNTAATQYLANLKAKKPVDEPGLLGLITAATVTWTGNPNSALGTAIIQAGASIQPLFQSLSETASEACMILPGPGGVGGPGFGPKPHGGARGQEGGQGTLAARELVFDGRASDLDVVMPFAFPDQCQMLLNKANALFFQNSPTSKQDASTLYKRLLKRLSFWPTIAAAQDATSPPPESNLEQAYDTLEYGLKVTVSALDQLQSVYDQAKSFNNQIMSGNDMFGHDALWVPRLNYSYYTAEIETCLSTLKTVEAAYANALAVRASMTDIASGQSAAAAGVQRAQYRIQLLTDDNGPLTTSADTIARYTPLLKDKVKECEDNLAVVEADIQASINLDPMNIISSLSMVAMGPSVPLALVEGASIAYNADTTVKDSSGASVNKDYVISELKTAGSSLSDLSTGFSTRQDQTIEADDPGGLKMIAAEDQITSLYNEFKSVIPAGDGDALTKSLADLQSVATTRNNAVISYNSAVELLHQAETDEAYYGKQQQAYGDQAAKAMNPNLPAVLLWLRRTQDSYQLETMRLMNYANRAIAYWGLTSPAEFAAPGPLQGSQSLSISKTSLDQAAESAITSFAGSAPGHFPVAGRQGPLYKLDYGQLATLTEPLTSPDGAVYYSVTIALDVGASDGSADLPLFAGRANIRLDLARLWLVGASVSADQTGAKPVSVVLTQLGSETMENDRRATFNFRHDAVTIPFQFDSAAVNSLADCTADKVLETQFLANYYVGQGNPAETAIAAIGPWSTWTFEVRESENKDLDMSNLSEAYIEFGGYCSPF